MVRKLKNKVLTKTLMLLLKVIPMVIASLYFLNVILSYLGIDCFILSRIGGMSLLPWLFLLLSSYKFKFCSYHRMFLWYILTNDVLTWIDYEYTIPLSVSNIIGVHLIVAAVFLFIIIYLKFKVCQNH